MTQKCAACYYCRPIAAVGGATDSGTCRFNPAVLRYLDDGRTQGSYSPVSLDQGWCGKWLARSWWRRLLKI